MRDPNLPSWPFTHVIEEKDRLLILSFSDVFRVDKTLKFWKKVAFLSIAYEPGRPDAVGSYPSVRAVYPPTREGEPFVVATRCNGFLLLEGTKVKPAFPGQLGARDVSQIENTPEGIIAFEKDEQLDPWILRSNGWELASLAPPFEVDEENADVEPDMEGTWDKTRVLVGPDGVIYTVSGTEANPGIRVTGRRVGGKTVRLGHEKSILDPSHSFITPDGTLWNLNDGALGRFEDGRWTVVNLAVTERPRDLTPLISPGPPWLLLDRYYGEVWRLAPDANGNDSQFTQVEIFEEENAIHIRSAIPWSDGALLLATDVGLKLYVPKTQRLSKFDLEGPTQSVTALVRDRLGHLWLGSENGLWMVDTGGKVLESLDRVPAIEHNAVTALVADPRHADGIVVALGTHGIVFVRALPRH